MSVSGRRVAPYGRRYRKTRTGIMDREAACANLDENGSRHISDRREPPPRQAEGKPEDMTEEQGN